MRGFSFVCVMRIVNETTLFCMPFRPSFETTFVFAIQRWNNHSFVRWLAITSSRLDVLFLFLVGVIAASSWYVGKLPLPLFTSIGLAFLTHYILVEGLCKRSFIRRKRPHIAAKDTLKPLGVVYRDSSFPSGHAAIMTALSVLIGHTFPFTLPFLGLLVGVVGWSRLACGMHYPSDVLAGILLGAAYAGVILTFLPYPA
jgi:undecaprenyl-diphosphatase